MCRHSNPHQAPRPTDRAGSGSYCHAIVRVVDGKVAEVNYTGDNDDFVGKEGVCAPIVRGCLRAHGGDPEAKTKAVAARPIGG